MMIQSDGIIAEGWKKIREEVRSYSLSLSRPIAHTSPGGFCGMQIFVVIIFDIISNGAKKIKFRMELLYMYILD
jgi:hypothetical protein